MKKRTKVFYIFFACLALLAFLLFLLIWNGVILLNGMAASHYPIKGVDVSAYQGEIDWPVLVRQDVSFAFIKATEGSSFVDKYFEYNFEQANAAGIAVGAYHFFSFDSPGETQAENFIRTVPADAVLPAVVDLEFYADKEKDPPVRRQVHAQLQILLDMLEQHYGKKPIIYATEESYETYLSGAFADYDIWIRNVFTSPTLSDGRDWTFWQFTNRARLDGYCGQEKYIDLNVFYGTREEWEEYCAA